MPHPLLHDVLGAARDRLIAAGIAADEAAIDVDLFARTILGWDRGRLILARTSPPPPNLEPRLSEWIARRAAREPTAYIVGRREFWSLDFVVTPAVLIPRPETELVVEEALRLLGGVPDARLADIGTGSGCIAVSIAHDLPQCRVLATDISGDALLVARRNARRLGVADRVSFVQTQYLDGVGGLFDLIAANPPYVREGDWRGLAPSVRREPQVAIVSAGDGLEAIARVLDAAATHLRPRGWLVMEFGFGQEDDVRRLLDERAAALHLERIREDLQGIARTVVVRRG